MRTVLHVLTQPNDRLAADIIERERSVEHKIEIVDLTGSDPDYKGLLEKIFEADSVQVW
jgi:hypothetical protein